jgi:hypothetical protein
MDHGLSERTYREQIVYLGESSRSVGTSTIRQQLQGKMGESDVNASLVIIYNAKQIYIRYKSKLN